MPLEAIINSSPRKLENHDRDHASNQKTTKQIPKPPIITITPPSPKTKAQEIKTTKNDYLLAFITIYNDCVTITTTNVIKAVIYLLQALSATLLLLIFGVIATCGVLCDSLKAFMWREIAKKRKGVRFLEVGTDRERSGAEERGDEER